MGLTPWLGTALHGWILCLLLLFDTKLMIEITITSFTLRFLLDFSCSLIWRYIYLLICILILRQYMDTKTNKTEQFYCAGEVKKQTNK